MNFPSCFACRMVIDSVMGYRMLFHDYWLCCECQKEGETFLVKSIQKAKMKLAEEDDS